jgi:hypothetical protein
MTRASLMAVLCLAAALAGCDGQRPMLPPPPPHGGTAFPLPAGKGFVEALRHEVPDRAGRTQLVIYFLDPECRPLGSAPAAASFLPKARKATAVALKPTEDADPAKAGGLATTPFDDPGDIVGTLSATIDRTPVSVGISLR